MRHRWCEVLVNDCGWCDAIEWQLGPNKYQRCFSLEKVKVGWLARLTAHHSTCIQRLYKSSILLDPCWLLCELSYWISKILQLRVGMKYLLPQCMGFWAQAFTTRSASSAAACSIFGILEKSCDATVSSHFRTMLEVAFAIFWIMHSVWISRK